MVWQVNKRVIAVDPGVNLGLACIEVDMNNRELKVLDAHTCSLNKVAEEDFPELIELVGIQLTRIHLMNKVIGKYIRCWDPDYLTHETAFSAHGRGMNSGSIESFASLRENILGIKMASLNADQNIPIIPTNPSTVKYRVIGKKNSDKDQMLDGVKSLSDLDSTLVDLDKLDQHGVDAIAIGYTFIIDKIFGSR